MTIPGLKLKLCLLSILTLCCLLLIACHNENLNNPHRSASTTNTYYSSFDAPPKTLDPALAYSADQLLFIAQIYEPPLQYDYLARPYKLIPATATQMPKVGYLDIHGQPLPDDAPASKVAYTIYDIQIQPGIYYQQHPAFARDEKANYLYHQLAPYDFANIKSLSDFKHTDTRELIAEDYVYEIKRLAHPRVNSPILGLMEKHIVGLADYAKTLNTALTEQSVKLGPDAYFDLRNYPLSGAKVLDRYTYRITIYGKYPEFIYWLAMPFFAPIPWEADKFYSQPKMREHNISFNWYPIGTGPYQLTKNNPNSEMVLSRNPHFHKEFYPTQASLQDRKNGLLNAAGKQLPFIDKFVFSLEKESVPRWNKFLQGYYDTSAISSDSFDQAIQVDAQGEPQLTSAMQQKGIRLQTSLTPPNIYFFGFNMLDDVVGGNSERARKLRQAISIALNTEEFIKIFLNGRGMPAQGPLPPQIFGYVDGKAGSDPYIYNWVNGKPQRKPLSEAKRLLAEAGYPNGLDPKTGKPLILNYDAVATGGPDDKARFDWMREKFAELGIQLNIRATQYNRFHEKMRTGNAQMFFWGWFADYPDPENFLFLLYGPNGKVKTGGENNSNYENKEYDRLFEQMKVMPNGPERQAIINRMVAIVQHDAPWVWGLHYKQFILLHQWVGPIKADALGNNSLKYRQVDPNLRAKMQQLWNKPNWWPLLGMIILLLIILLPVFFQYWRKENSPRIKKYHE